MLPRGTRAGILVGVLPLAVEDATELAMGLYLNVPVGVLVPDRGGGCERATLPVTLPARECAAETGALLGFDEGASPEGVFERGGKHFAVAAANSSMYRTPCTKNGRPYSSSCGYSRVSISNVR